MPSVRCRKAAWHEQRRNSNAEKEVRPPQDEERPPALTGGIRRKAADSQRQGNPETSPSQTWPVEAVVSSGK